MGASRAFRGILGSCWVVLPALVRPPGPSLRRAARLGWVEDTETERWIRQLEERLIRGANAGVLAELVLAFCDSPRLAEDPRRVRHVVALAEADARNTLLRSPAGVVDPASDPAMFQKGIEVWERRLREDPESPEIVVGAATFLTSDTRPRGRRLLEEFEHRVPGMPEVQLALGQLAEGPEARLMYLKRAAAAGSKQPNLPSWIASAAIEARDFETVGEIARWLVADLSQPDVPGDRFRENQRRAHWHWAQTLLGVLAVQRRDLESATRCLHQSIEREPDFRMRSYGPSMHLARALCERGAFEAVAGYLRACRAFWPEPVLDEWLEQVLRQQVPAFQPTAE